MSGRSSWGLEGRPQSCAPSAWVSTPIGSVASAGAPHTGLALRPQRLPEGGSLCSAPPLWG